MIKGGQMSKRWRYGLGTIWAMILLVSAHPAVQREVDRMERESPVTTSEDTLGSDDNEGATGSEEPSLGLEEGERTASPPPVPAQPQPSLPPYTLDQAPNRPSWLGISGEPTDTERRDYQERMRGYEAFRLENGTAPTRSASVRERILRIRDQVILREDVPGAWHWSQVRSIIAAFGSPERPIVCDAGSRLAEDCVAFTHLNRDYLGINEVVMALESDRSIEGVIVHEATHLAMQQEYERYSGFSGKEHGLLVEHCRDVARAQLLATEMIAFYNQARYISASSPMAPIIDVEDPRLEAVSAGYNGDESARQRFMYYVEAYVTIEIRNVPPNQCGLPVAVRGAYQGLYTLFYDLVQAEVAPFFVYGTALP